jgi:hypothetical protein
MFDPYHKWLAIPKGQRPPTCYQLLGVAPDEDDAEVIEEAAIRQTSHVRTYQTGPHTKECTDLLNEIARARTTLLSPTKRKEYDARLDLMTEERGHQQTAPLANSVAAVAPLARPLEDTPFFVSPLGQQPLVFEPTGELQWPSSARRDRRLQATLWLLCYTALLFLGGAMAFWLASSSANSSPGRGGVPAQPVPHRKDVANGQHRAADATAGRNDVWGAR